MCFANCSNKLLYFDRMYYFRRLYICSIWATGLTFLCKFAVHKWGRLTSEEIWLALFDIVCQSHMEVKILVAI